MIRKLAALLMSTLSGPELTDEEREAIRDLGFRHFIFFKRHFQEKEQISALMSEIKTLSERLAQGQNLLAVDQEGGRVQRIGPPLVPEFPEPFEVARRGPSEVEKFSREIGRSVSFLGLNLNLAPVLDLAGEGAPDFLRGRTFGEDPKEVARFGEVFIRAHLEEGVFPCAKHFPGLGGIEKDPHEELPEIQKVRPEDLWPFKNAVAVGVPFMMTTHLVVKSWDDKPLTFSERAVDILRRELSFCGPVVTDDLAMKGLSAWEWPERLIYALAAGHDLLLFCRPLPELLPVLFEVAKEISTSRVLREKLLEGISKLSKVSLPSQQKKL
ncbi:MAG TPA: glycoside hydrolase family 3 protein [Thermodesulfobacteriaceae bacterium]|nr:glycoside hydrolase family 3 protein [Thermodesulfobacteriaceae bacterium]